MLTSVSDTLQPSRTERPVVEIDSSPTYELLLGLLEFGYQRAGLRLPPVSDWVTTAPAHLSREVLGEFDELGPRCWLWHSLLFMAWEFRAARHALHPTQFIERIRTMEAQSLFEALLGCRGPAAPVSHAIVEQAVSGNGAARRKIGKVLFADDPTEEVALSRLLGMPPARVQTLLVHIIDGWYHQILRPDERELATRLANEARTKRIIGRSAPTRLLRASAIGIHYLPRRTVKRVVLIPSTVCRPSVVTIRFGATRIFFYPLPDERSENDELPSQMVKMHAALADRERLRILQSLLRGERSVESLSRELGLSQQAITAQLITLRDGGLVMLRMDERRTTFQIRRNLPSIVFRSLQALLPEDLARTPPVTA